MLKLFLTGNLTKDPELRTTPTGMQVCAFTVAVNKRHGEEAVFLKVNAWRGLAETCQKNLAKGRKVGVIGDLNIRSYEVNGEKRTSVEVTADEVEFLSPKEVQPKPQVNDFIDIKEDDFPF